MRMPVLTLESQVKVGKRPKQANHSHGSRWRQRTPAARSVSGLER